MLLMGILALLFVPFDFFSSFNTEAATAKVAGDIRFARELSSSTNVNCGVQFVADGSYTVYQSTPATPATNPHTREPYVVDLGDVFENVDILNSIQVEFDPMGRPVMGGGRHY